MVYGNRIKFIVFLNVWRFASYIEVRWDKTKRQEGVLYGKIEVRTDMLKTSIFRTFCHESFESSHLITQFRWILNQQTVIHHVIPSLAYLVEDNSLYYYWGLSTQVIHFFNGALYGTRIML